MIHEATIDAVLTRLDRLSDRAYQKEMRRLLATQPVLAEDALQIEDEFPSFPHVRFLGTLVGLLAIFEEAYPHGIDLVSGEDLDAALERTREEATAFATGEAPLSQPREEELLALVAAQILGDKDPEDVDQESVLVFFAMRAVLDCLTDAAARSRRGPVAVPAPPREPERNDACPCGSGKKYKKCCLLAKDEAKAEAREALRAPLRELEKELVDAIDKHAHREGLEPDTDVPFEFDPSQELGETLAIWHAPSGGRTLAEHFFEARGARLSPLLRAWFEAQRAAWLSIWEVTEVDRGTSITLTDLLSGEHRVVHDVKASETAEARLAILARVVEFEGNPALFGLHAGALAPLDVAPIIARWKRKFGRSKAKALERLRSWDSAYELALNWDEAVAVAALTASSMPELHNTDGDPFLFTRERFAYDPAQRPIVLAKLLAIDGSDLHHTKQGPVSVLLYDGDPEFEPDASLTLLARIELGESELIVETNSLRRADDARAKLEGELGPMVRRGLREHVDPSAMLDGSGAAVAADDEPTPEEAEVIIEATRQHYATWPDIALPALRGKSPREAARTKAGREKVVALLKHIELAETRKPDAIRFDVGELYAALGIERE
jgi:hypothetical protein